MNDNYLEMLYNTHQYNKIINIFNTAHGCKTDKLKLYAGFLFTKMGMAEKAIDCLSSIDYRCFPHYTGTIFRYMGISNYCLGNYDTAQILFELGLKYKDNECALWNKLLFPLFDDLRVTDNIIFRFVDKIEVFDRKIFILKNLQAFNRISDFIGEFNCDKKIDIYIYTQRYDSIGNSLSYSDNGLKCIHTYLYDVNGHEIAHILFNSIYKHMKRNRFIDEGIATFFDNENTLTDYLIKVKDFFPNLDIIELWNNQEYTFEDAKGFYYLAGAFVGFLIETYGKQKFIEFIQDEDYRNARKVFGITLESTIKSFYNIIK